MFVVVQMVASFREEFVENGPASPNVAPVVAIDRLSHFKDQFDMLERKREMLRQGASGVVVAAGVIVAAVVAICRRT